MIYYFNMFKYLFYYSKLFLWLSFLWIHDKYYPINIDIYECLLQTILLCGCIPIKFIQWCIPYLYLTSDKKYYEIIKLFEKTYENCNFHSMDYTKKIYYRDFNKNFNDEFCNIKEIASGSIGQVYKITNKHTHKNYALKVIHPGIYYELYLINIILKSILFIFPIHKIICFNIYDFYQEFKKQSDFINEANNLLYFYHKYIDNHKIRIPELYKISNHLLIMEYIDGDKINMNNYLLISLFIMNNLNTLQLNHGDLHPGNFRIKKNQLVIYDFGYCWLNNIPNDLFNCFSNMVHIYDDDFINLYSESEREELFLSLIQKLNIDVKYFHNMIHDFKILNIRNPKEYVLFLINIHKKYNLKMNSNIINLFLTIIITNKYSQNSYNLDMYNYCKTYDIFKDYQLILKNNIQKKKTNIRTNYNEFEHLKKYI